MKQWTAAIGSMPPEVAALEPVTLQRGHALLHKGACTADTGGGCICEPASVVRPDIALNEHDLVRHIRAATRECHAQQARGRH